MSKEKEARLKAIGLPLEAELSECGSLGIQACQDEWQTEDVFSAETDMSCYS